MTSPQYVYPKRVSVLTPLPTIKEAGRGGGERGSAPKPRRESFTPVERYRTKRTVNHNTGLGNSLFCLVGSLGGLEVIVAC